MPQVKIHFVMSPADDDTAVITGTSAKTGKKIKLSHVNIAGTPDFFIAMTETALAAVESAIEAQAVIDQLDLDEYEEALVQKVRTVIRELRGPPAAAG